MPDAEVLGARAKYRLAGDRHGRQNRDLKRATGMQGTLFGPVVSSRLARRRRPPKQTTVIISAKVIAAVTVGRIDGERAIAEAFAPCGRTYETLPWTSARSDGPIRQPAAR